MPLRAPWPQPALFSEESMLDLIYVIGVVGLFALIALVARGVEKL
ncbi:hypothetical protein [Lacisediminihabitans sp. H27-G8]